MRTAYARSVPSFLAACALLCCTALPALAAAWKPEENLEIVVAGGPGGGTDQLARLVQSAMQRAQAGRTAYARSVPSFLAACALLCCTALPALAAAWKPEENLEIVVAGGPGGGTDQLARLVQSAISQNKLLDVNTVVLNKGGGNGAEAFLDLKLAKGNAHKLVIGTNNVYLLPLVARLGYQWTDLTPVAAVAEDDFILWTYQAAPWADAAAFLADLKKDATGMRFGGSQSKDVDQTLSLLLGKQVGGKLTYIPFKSGSEASIQLAGRHIAANLNNPAESLSQWRGGQVRPLCYLLPLVARLGYQWTDLTPVAAVAEDDFILWTYQAAPWADAAAFLADLKKDATGMRFGGSQSKDVDQTLSLLLGKQVGGKLTYIPFKSGSEASIQLAGRHIAANLNNPAESLSQWRGGQVRPLCVFSHERMIYTAKVAAEQSWADIPTCHEQGLGIDQYRFPRTVFLPGGVSDEQRAFYVELMRKVSQTAEFRDYVERSALAPTFLAGEDLVSYIEKDRQRVIPLFQEAGWLRQ